MDVLGGSNFKVSARQSDNGRILQQASGHQGYVDIMATAFGHLDKFGEMISAFQELKTLEKTEITSSQRSVIKLQAKLLKCNDDQLKFIQSTVETTVKETVQAGISSYRDGIKKNSRSPAMSSVTLKRAVKEDIIEEDRSRNLLVFGLPEEDVECLEEKVSEVLQELGEKPRVEVTRIGGTSVKPCRDPSRSLSQTLCPHDR